MIRISGKSLGVNPPYLCLQVDFAEERPATDLCSFDCPNQWPCIVYFPSQGILCFQDGPIASLQIYAPQELFCVVESESCSSAEQAPIRAAAGAGALFGPGLWRQIFHSEVTRGNPCLMWEYLRLSKGARAKADWKPLCQFFDALTHEKYFEFKSLHFCAFFTGEKGSVICADLVLQILPVWRNWWQKVPQLLLQLTRQCWRTGLSLGKLASTKIAICKKCFRRYSSKLLQCPSLNCKEWEYLMWGTCKAWWCLLPFTEWAIQDWIWFSVMSWCCEQLRFL